MISQSAIPRMKRPRLKLTPVIQTEAQVLRDVRRFLTAHPRVAWFARINSGAAMLGDPESPRFVRFCDIEGQDRLRHAARRGGALADAVEDQMELMSDLLGQLVDGRTLALELKSGTWRGKPRNARERAQARFLARVARSGGVSGFVASLRDAEQLLRAYANA